MAIGSRRCRHGHAGTTRTRRPRVERLEERQLLSNTYTVTNTLDDGSAGSLRWAITQVDGDTTDSAVSPDRIEFNIPQSDPGNSAGICTIAPLSLLPSVTQPVVIDGYTQAGAAPNTNGPALPDNAHLTVVLRGDQQSAPQNQGRVGLTLASPNVVVRGLIVERFASFAELGGTGIVIDSPGGDVVAGNFLGTDDTSSSQVGNYYGITILGSESTIGGTTPDARNVISGNIAPPSVVGAGVNVVGDRNVVEGNFIGTDTTGTASVPNSYVSVLIDTGASTTIGGTTAEARNIIVSSAAGYGVMVEGQGASGNLVEGNFIGTDVTGTVAAVPGTPGQPNTAIGIAVSGDNTVGGTAAGAGNVIAGNGRAGIQTEGGGTGPGPLIEGNFIGTDVSGSKPLPNGVGVALSSAATTIGGTIPAARNVIAGNQGAAIAAIGNTSAFSPLLTADLIAGNFIGTDATGQTALPNQAGVVLDGTRNVTVGGTAQGAGNLVSGNAGDGIVIESTLDGLGALGNVVAGNFIGCDATGQKPLGNGGNGVSLLGQTTPGFELVQQNTVGGTAAGAANVIAFNQAAGVAVVGGNTYGDPIQENSIYGNTKLGIDLGGSGTPLADGPGYYAFGPDGPQNYPFLTGSAVVDGATVVTGSLNTGLPHETDRIEFFSSPAPDPSGFGQGKTYLGAIDVTSDGNNHVAFTFRASGDLTGQVISATATSPEGNTSEFSPDVPPPLVTGPPITLAATPDPALAGQTMTLTATLDFEPLRLGNTLFGTDVAPTGALLFFVDGQPLKFAAALQPGGGTGRALQSVASSTVFGLPGGTHTITARYLGGNFPPSESPPLTVTVVHDLPAFASLSVSANPVTVGRPLTLYATVGSAGSLPGQSLPAPTGFVDFRAGAVMLGRAALDASGHAQYTTSALGAGSHGIVAYYEGDAIYAAATSTIVAEFVPPNAGPTVVSVRRYGGHPRPTSLVVTFSEPLDTATAQNVNNYAIQGPGRRPIPVSFALYDAAADTVTLIPARNLAAHGRYLLTVKGATPGSVADAYGYLLDGAGTGRPGSDYVTTLTRANLVTVRRVPAGPRHSGPLRRRQH